MLCKKTFRRVNIIAIFAMVFASFAPILSHAMVLQQSNHVFTQSLCASSGSPKIVQQLGDVSGKLISSITVTSNASQPNPSPANASVHLEHCPFCSAGVATFVIAPCTHTWLVALTEQAKRLDLTYVPIVHPVALQTAHAPRAPPTL